MRVLQLAVAAGMLTTSCTASAGEPANPHYPHGSLAYEPCLRTDECRFFGRCRTSDDGCVAARDQDCRWSAVCSESGRCYLNEEDRECDDGTRAADQGVLASGFVTLGFGGAAMLSSIVPFMLASLDCWTLLSPPKEDCGETGNVLGGIMLGGGLALVMGVALPLVIVGGRRVPRVAIGPAVVVGSF